ncbi:TonB-dependent receptor [Symbiopectobacterium purcellii]|uniref:TonB-dependent receptor n=1 Tax=Symbiopectobacterium purcellii TaxID=2871826 RepID=UPI003F84BDE4
MLNNKYFCHKRVTYPMCVCAGYALCGAVAATPVDTAQPPTEQEDDSVVWVTARKIKEDSLRVPLSLSVFDKQTIEDRRIDDIARLIRGVPNIGMSALGDGRSTHLSMRGVGTLAQPLGHDDTSVVTYIDGVPQPLFGSDLRFLNVERIEVLRGPQGTVFGRNAQAGAINIITRQPSDDAQHTLRAEGALDRHSQNLGQLTFSGPLRDDMLKGSFSAAYADQGGDVRNQVGGWMGREQDGAMRTTLLATPDDITQLVLALSYGRDRLMPSNFVLQGTPNFPSVALDPKGWAHRETGALSLTANRTLRTLQVTSVTAFNRYDFDNLTNNSEALTYGTWFNQPSAAFLPALDWSTYDEKQRSFYQELRMSSLDKARVGWVGGMNYLHDDYRLMNDYTTTSLLAPSNVSSMINGKRNNHYQTDSYALFGELTTALTDSEKLKGTLGLRYTHDSKGYHAHFQNNGHPGNVAAFDQQGRLQYDMVTGRAALHYQLTRDAMLYTSVARGAKSGGFPNFTNNAPSGMRDEPYQASSSWSYEVGSKNRVAGGRGEWNLALFYNQVRNEHMFAKERNSMAFTPQSIDTASYGAELEGGWQVAEHWRLGGGVGYTHAELRNVPSNVADKTWARDGYRVPAVPRFTTSLTMAYYDSAAVLGIPAANVFALAQHQFIAQREANVDNNFTLPAYRQINLRAGLEFPSLDVYLFAQNLTNERPQYTGISYMPGVNVVTVGHGRVIGAGMKVHM